ncbi:hypothetical protein GCM10023188_25940 [Pontibacter saemangeumensis]|uniref:Phage terminase small subunit n=1 Tax=Pontibacter saemangeumensis TaxID=1084525 RepID=A0ABP8LU44_9BACT
MAAKLTDKQQRFCEEYLVDLNATQAAIRAGYSEKTANREGSRLLSKVDIHARVQELQQQRSEKLNIDTEWVLRRLVAISDKCMQAEPVMKWDPEEKAMVETGEYQFDSQGANKATEMIGKHIGFFEKDNEQGKVPLVIPEIKVYTGAPPLASSEREVDM